MSWTDFEIEMTQGDDREFDLFVLDAAGAPVDITTWLKFWFTARSSLATGSDTGAEIALTSDPGGGLTIQDALAGQVRARIQPAVTRQLSRRSHHLFADFQGKDASGKVKTIMRGRLLVLPDVTVSTV